jgi:hypothetical protein
LGREGGEGTEGECSGDVSKAPLLAFTVMCSKIQDCLFQPLKTDWKIKNTLSSHAIVSCRCDLIMLYAVILHLVTAVMLHLVTAAHTFDFIIVIN